MSQLSAAFKSLKQSEYEKENAVLGKPLIRFYPNPGKLSKAKRQTIELSVNPGDDLLENTYKVQYSIFEGGTVEDLLEWKEMLEKIISRKPLKQAKARFHMARTMLEGPAKSKFNAFAAKICDQPGTNHLAEPTAAPGETVDSYEDVIRAFIRSHFKPVADSLLTQREYMQHGIRYPTFKGVPLREWVDRLMSINSKLREFPTPKGYTGTKYFSEPELRRVLLKALPRSYQLKVRTSAKTLDQFTLEELQDFLETCLDEAESKNAEKANSKKNNKNNKSYDSNSDKKKGKRRRRLKRPK